MKQLLILTLLFLAACSNTPSHEGKSVDTTTEVNADMPEIIDTSVAVIDSQKIIIREFFTDLLEELKVPNTMVVRYLDGSLLYQLGMVKQKSDKSPFFGKKSNWTYAEVARVRQELKSSELKEWGKDYFPTTIKFDTTGYSNCLIKGDSRCDEEREEFAKTYFMDDDMRVIYYQFSEPVFTTDGNWAMVSLEERCFGECGYGSLVICQKVNNHWKIIEELNLWIG